MCKYGTGEEIKSERDFLYFAFTLRFRSYFYVLEYFLFFIHVKSLIFLESLRAIQQGGK